MHQAIGVDIYGTLVDPLDMDEHLRPLVGDRAERLSALWRQKQLEYAFRRGLMGMYENFDVCTEQALLYAEKTLGVRLSETDRAALAEEYQNLRPFPDAAPALREIGQRGYTLVAFSNGVESTARTLLARAGLLAHLRNVVSVDDVRTYKPAPEVYRYLTRRLGRRAEEVWLVSGNAFDVIGAKAAGLRAAWIKRRPEATFDPWGIEPDLTATDLLDLAKKLR